MKLIQKIPYNIIIIVKQYLFAIPIYFAFRLILFFTEINRIDDSINFIDILHAFLFGLRFDIVASGYILILPFVLLSINTLIEKDLKFIKQFIFVWINLFFISSFFVCVANIPYFNQFFTHITYSAFSFIDDNDISFVVGMIAEDFLSWIYIIGFLLASILFFFATKKNIFHTIPNQSVLIKNRPLRFVAKLFLFIVGFLLIFMGIRGRFALMSPIRVGTACFSNNAFLNQLGLNTNFVLLTSYFTAQKIENQQYFFMDDNEAIKNMREWLNITDSISKNPLEREGVLSQFLTENNLENEKPNVILVIMESMSAAKMGRYNEKNLTPFLDNLSQNGIYFENIYSTGMHTFCGVFATLYSFPTIWVNNPMKNIPPLSFFGLPNILGKNGYSTTFFSPHDAQFNNLGGFLYFNGYQKIVDNYPENVGSTWGIPDDVMFKYSIPIYNELAEKNKPFFATMLTVSDHLPYYIPPYFKTKNSKISDQAVEYADYSLRIFMELCAKEKWFENTIFVFTADHGAAIDATYNISLSYFHIPFLIYYPKLQNKSKENFNLMTENILQKIGSQVDITPTLFSFLEIPHNIYGLGINLFNENREFAVLNADDRYGVLNEEYLLIVEKSGEKALYKYKQKDKTNYLNEEKILAEKMELYAKSYFQSFDYIVRNNNRIYIQK